MIHKDKILALRSKGKSYREIQDILGCSKGTISYHVGEGQKEKTSNRRKSQRTVILKYIQEYKQSRPCADCKEDYPYYMKDFDHLGGKLFTLSKYKNYTTDLNIIKEEISKCDVVCANCHRIRTYSRSIKTGNSSLEMQDFYM